MSKTLTMLLLAAALGFAQMQSDPADATRKTPAQKGYHETSPKNKGATPESAKDKSAKGRKVTDPKTTDGLRTQTPPTRQPELAPPNKP